MAALRFLQRNKDLAGLGRHFQLSSYAPAMHLEGLVPGVDNVRHDVFLSPRFTEVARAHILRLISRHGQVEDFVVADPLSAAPPGGRRLPARAEDPAEFKRLLAELHVESLHRAKGEGKLSVDLVLRLAVIKFLRAELVAQFSVMLERGRARLRSYEGPRQASTGKAIELRERFARLQVSKKILLRKAGQELFQTLREVEKETLARLRRSLFGESIGPEYELFMNRLLFTEDGRDDYLNAEHYVMLGNFERDPDRFLVIQQIAGNFFRQINEGPDDDASLDGLLNAPENAQELVAGGTPDAATEKGKAQKQVLDAWVEMLEREKMMDHIVASYEAVPLLPQYSPPINAQQLKNALISRTERSRVELLMEEHGRLSTSALDAAVKRVASCRGADLAKVAGRFLGDFLRYHRDLRRLEALNSATDSVNVIANEKLRELSAINNTLYEFLLPEERRPAEEKVIHHVILKCDIRDSTTLTRSLLDRGLNPASYFSLNFYEPVNKLLSKYEATKVFIEGDAVILALFEREGEPGFGVSRTCTMAREMIDIVRAYNEQSGKSGLPMLELGIGVSYQDSAPLYLMDGASRIMISKALNESDRLSSCSKGARRYLASSDALFNVFAFQTVEDQDTGGNPDEFLLRYNVGGILMSPAAFGKLRQEISLNTHQLELPLLWQKEKITLYSGMVPVGSRFHRIVIREGLIPHIDARDFSLKRWTERRYYEVCTNTAIYEHVESGAAASSSA